MIPLQSLRPTKPLPTSGFLSSSLSLASILAVLFLSFAVFFVRSRTKARRALEEVYSREGERRLLLGVTRARKPQRIFFEWQNTPRVYIAATAIIVFIINIFSIVASALTEQVVKEPKFWLIKVVSIPAVSIFLFVETFLAPTTYTPPQLNFTLLLLLALILLVLAPIFTSIPVDTDRGRLGLARRILEHVAGPSLVLGSMIAVHYCVQEVHEPLGEEGDLSETPSIRSEAGIIPSGSGTRE
ncbi:hypothetical protein BDY24DRAFT_380869 [Mrakia frigida]|uniref:uncharacterized protein n=1 Tax=Mrakia frigida TaxID=29902 RepID=UPI003FCBFEFD